MGQAATSSSHAAKPRRVRKSPDTRRTELVSAAVTVFAETGYVDTGFADVAAKAKVSKALLYHYFPHGRPELLVASTGLLGFALANVELCLAGQVEAEIAWRITCKYAVGQFPG